MRGGTGQSRKANHEGHESTKARKGAGISEGGRGGGDLAVRGHGGVGDPRRTRRKLSVYGLIAATRRVAVQGPQPNQKRGPSDRRSVIFSPADIELAGVDARVADVSDRQLAALLASTRAASCAARASDRPRRRRCGSPAS